MKQILRLGILFACLAVAWPLQAEVRLMRQPDIAAGRVVFVYAGDLWTVPVAGGTATPLTTHPGVESAPSFSPDGQWIAFSGQYDGNLDVFVVPAAGGVPRRLTCHPGPDQVTGWSPDGKYVLFSSPRFSYSRFLQMYKIAVEGGFPEQLPLPMASNGSFSPDGRHYAYTSMGDPYTTWRRYRGGRMPVIWIYNSQDHSVKKVPQANSNDNYPQWSGDEIIFLSDRDRVMNLYAYQGGTAKIRSLTRFAGADIKSYGTDGKRIVFEREGYLHVMENLGSEGKRIRVDIPAELLNTRPRFVNAAPRITNWNISPTGKRLVFEARGEILTVPADKGDIRNLSRTPAAMERDPSWSPDGRWIAYFGEHQDEYVLKLADQKGESEPQIITLPDPGYYSDIRWSPDSKKLTFKDNRLNLFWLDLEKKTPVLVDTNTYFNFYNELNVSWSPDSLWFTYDKLMPNYHRSVFLYSLETGKATALTDGMSDAYTPAFDRNGKYIYFLASTNISFRTAWLDMTSILSNPTASLYAVVLSTEEGSPFKPESDEETTKDEKPAESKDKEGDKDKAAKPAEQSAAAAKPAAASEEKPKEEKPKDGVKPIRVDLENIVNRIVAFPVPAGNYLALFAGGEGKIFFLEANPASPGGNLHRYDLAKRKDETILNGINAVVISADGKKLGYSQNRSYFIADAEGMPKPGDGRVRTDTMDVWSEPAAEWRQMLREAWRINREWFYDPGMHGQDWPAIWKQYEAYLPHVAHRNDLNYIIGQMIGELAVGHAYVFGGETPEINTVPGGLLGADYEQANGLYRIKKIYQGENWNPGLRSPLTEPGINAKTGDYILEVEGRPVKASDNIYSYFLKTAGRQIRLKLNNQPSPEGAREVTVVPVPDETALRYREWLEGNRKRVAERSKGKVGYMFLPDTAGGGFTNFNRYFFPQIDKEGMVVDERFNGGGLIADYFVENLNRPLTTWWLHRYGKNISSPFASIYGPKCLLINEYAGSGGDAFPYLFQQAGIGKMVGKRTWGGLVGITGYPPLMDGGSVTSPSISIVSKDGKFVVENAGVSPDVEVDITPADYIAGRDPQLEKAIDIVMEELKAKPVPVFKHEPFPRGR